MFERFLRGAAMFICTAGTLGLPAPALAQAPPTFSKDVAPIIFTHCSTCHRPGGASFNLTSYAEVKRRARLIADTMQRRVMPPWKPDPGASEFDGDRRLSDRQITTVRQWVDGGAPEGDPAALPPLPRYTSDWRLGPPDLILTMDAPYTLRAGGDDMYRHFVIRVPITTARYIKAWEFRPGNPRVVHHATMEFDRTGTSRRLDEQDPEPGYEGLIAHTSSAPDGYFLDWAPGHTPYTAPSGMAIPLEPGADLVLMLHLRPSGKPETVQASVGLYFADAPPTRVPALLRLTAQDIDIPPGDPSIVVTRSFRLPVDLDLLTVQPHAHYLARRVEGIATLPGGATRRLISISDWDFNWQDVYRYRAPVSLPAGTVVTMRWQYDNSAGNPRNPSQPPKRVTYGQRTSDEMSELWFQVMPRSQADRDVFTRAMRSAIFVEDIKGYEAMIAADSSNAALHDDVALMYAAIGNREKTVAHFAETARLRPDSAAAQYNLATALAAAGRLDEAQARFARAISLDPAYALAHYGLARLLNALGRTGDAVSEYREALRLQPDWPVVQQELEGVLKKP